MSKRFYDIKNVFSSDFDGGMVKDFDFKSRTVTGYFSRFGNVDHDKDMMMPGSFMKSIKERGQEGKNLIPHLADHIMDTDHLLSKPKLYELPDGGFFESPITDTTKALDILKQYRDGLIGQHSFGFKVLRKEDKGDYREIKEVLLYEISSVVLGANENTPFNGFKSLTPPQLVKKYNHLQKCYRDGDYSDEFFQILDAQIKQIEQDLLEMFIKDMTMSESQADNPKCPECGADMVDQGEEGMMCPNCGNTIKTHNTETTTPTVTTVTLPEVIVFDEKLNNIINRVNKVTTNGKLRKIGEGC